MVRRRRWRYVSSSRSSALHIGLLLALKNGLSADVIPQIIHSTQAIIIETIKPTPPVPKPMQPEISNPVIEPVEVPEPVIDPVEQAPPDVIAVTPPVQDAPVSTGTTAITVLQVDPRNPITRPEYPVSSIRERGRGNC